MIALRPVHFVLLAALAAFGFSLAGEFHLDDYSIAANPMLTAPAGVLDLWRPIQSRPLTEFTFWLNYQLGGKQPLGYHALNLALHLGAVWLLFGVLRRYVPEAGAAAGAALFALHPIQAEAVNYVFARGSLLATLFCLLAWREWARERDWRALAWFAVALLAKEECVTFPLFLLLLRRSWKPVASMLALSVVAGARVLWATAAIAGSGAGAQSGVAPLDYLCTQGLVVLRYLRLLAWPSGFSFDAGFDVVRDWRGWAAWLAIAAGAVFAWRRQRWLVGWLILIAPSSTFLPAQDLSADRRVYLPMLALSLCVGAFATRLDRKWITAMAALLALLSGMRTWVWASEQRLWTEAVESAPQHLAPRIQLARASEPTAALRILAGAQALAPNDARVPTEKGALLLSLNRPAEALGEFGRALALVPDSALAMNNRGVALMALDQREAAIADFRRALALDPQFADARRNLERLGEVRSK